MILKSHLVKLLTYSSVFSFAVACSDYEFFSDTELPTWSPQEHLDQEKEQDQTREDENKPASQSQGQGHDQDLNERQDKNKDREPQSEQTPTQGTSQANQETESQNTEAPQTNADNSDTSKEIKSLALLGDSIGVGMVSGSKLGHLVFSDEVLNQIGLDLIQGTFKIESYDAHFKVNGYDPFTSQKLNSLAVNLGINASNRSFHKVAPY